MNTPAFPRSIEPVAAFPAFETARVDDRPALRRISTNELGTLHRVLAAQAISGQPPADGYALSAAYYAMTGRKGLWLYANTQTFMLIAAHPNRDGHLLLFPPIGQEPVRLLNEAMHDHRLSASPLQLARMGDKDRLLPAWAEASGHFEITSEDLLDWTYPVHTLSTQALREHSGQAFRDFRKNIARAERRGLSASLVTSAKDRQQMLGIADAWASATVHAGYSRDDLTAPTQAAVALMETASLPLHALLIRRGERPEGFIVWEETLPGRKFANSVCGIALPGKGSAEFAYLAMAEELHQRGFDRVCIGGSETAGLDAFKRKMNPVASTDLRSAYALRR